MTNEDKKEKVYIFYRESLIQSVLSDTYSFGMILFVLWINYILLGNNGFTTVFFLILWFIWLLSKGYAKRKVFNSKKDLQKFLENKND